MGLFSFDFFFFNLKELKESYSIIFIIIHVFKYTLK